MLNVSNTSRSASSCFTPWARSVSNHTAEEPVSAFWQARNLVGGLSVVSGGPLDVRIQRCPLILGKGLAALYMFKQSHNRLWRGQARPFGALIGAAPAG
jgi:hypothetical protein